MKVTLRQRNQGGKTSLYLDYYNKVQKTVIVYHPRRIKVSHPRRVKVNHYNSPQN